MIPVLYKLNRFLNSGHKQDQKPLLRFLSETVPKWQKLERSLGRENGWGQVIIPCALYYYWLQSERQKIRSDFITFSQM